MEIVLGVVIGALILLGVLYVSVRAGDKPLRRAEGFSSTYDADPDATDAQPPTGSHHNVM